MNNHIILTAFGTTTRAAQSYQFLHARIAPRFPDCVIHWAFSSPTVRRSAGPAAAPRESLTDVVGRLPQGGRIVVQSLHLLPGHEFDRTAKEIAGLNVPAALGMPLLHAPSDFQRLAVALHGLVKDSGQSAALILGHGTDHPCRASYSRLVEILNHHRGPRIFFSTIEKPLEPPEQLIKRIHDAGYRQVFCIPLLLVAGMHFLKDIDGDHQSSWRNMLKKHRIEIDLHDRGLAYLSGVDDIFCDHIAAAFDSLTA